MQDHMKSKKHMSALEQKKDRYPEVIEKINQIQPKYLKESDKPNNGDRLAYRWEKNLNLIISFPLYPSISWESISPRKKKERWDWDFINKTQTL